MVSLSKLIASKGKKAAEVVRQSIRNKNTMPSRGRPRSEKKTIDAVWMKARMDAVGIRSFAELSRGLGIDKAMMSKSLSGERVFSVKDVARMADTLKTSTDEVMRRLGYDVPKIGVPFVGKVMPDGRVSAVAARKGQQFYVQDAPPGAQALLAEGPPGYVGAVFLYVPQPAGKPVPLTMLGQLCVVEADNHVTPYLGTIVKGSGRGKLAIDLFGLPPDKKIDIETIHAASPVVSIHFQ